MSLATTSPLATIFKRAGAKVVDTDAARLPGDRALGGDGDRASGGGVVLQHTDAKAKERTIDIAIGDDGHRCRCRTLKALMNRSNRP